MPMIFKYFSESVIEHVFERDGFVGVKCSLPQDYNDPFELFLGVDLDQGSDLLATYREVVKEIPELLTTCFSKSPVVAPMWAHYANNHQGFVIGFETTAMEESFKNLMVRDITYRNGPNESLAEFAKMAAFRCKPRDAMALRNAVYYEGYFSKYSEWGYEQEARAINLEEHIENVSSNNILYVPEGCVTDIICGKNASKETENSLSWCSDLLGADLYSERIGRSYPRPYLMSDTGSAQVFSDGLICAPIAVCGECSEPLKSSGHLCPWCSIDDNDGDIAANVNPLRMLDSHGLLERYIETFPRLERKPYKGP